MALVTTTTLLSAAALARLLDWHQSRIPLWAVVCDPCVVTFGSMDFIELNDKRVRIRIETVVHQLRLLPCTPEAVLSFTPDNVMIAFATRIETENEPRPEAHESLQLIIRDRGIVLIVYRQVSAR
jgi:hypothetical protein